MNFRELAKSLELKDEEYLELIELFIEIDGVNPGPIFSLYFQFG